MQFDKDKKYFTTSADLDNIDHIIKSNLERLKHLNIKPKTKTTEIQCQTSQFVPKQSKVTLLTQAINQFTSQVTEQVQKDQPLVQQLIDKIKAVIKVQLNVEAQIFGSYATNLALPYSDVDIVVDCPSIQLIMPNIKLLEQQFQKCEFIQETKLLCFAAIPLLKLKSVDQYLNKRIDISFQESKHYGLQCVNLINQYQIQFSQLRPLTLVMKSFLQKCNLIDPYQGGLSSYGITLMIVSYCQSKWADINNNNNNNNKLNQQEIKEQQSLGQQLIEFLYLYGCEMDYISKTIYVFRPEEQIHGYPIFFNTQLAENSTPTLIIQDPLNDRHNVGRPTYNIQAIKFIFAIGFAKLINYQNENLDEFMNCNKQLTLQLQSNVTKIYNY